MKRIFCAAGVVCVAVVVFVSFLARRPDSPGTVAQPAPSTETFSVSSSPGRPAAAIFTGRDVAAPNPPAHSHPASAAVFREFEAWADRYAVAASDAERAALESEGVKLAQARLEVLADVIQTDPAQALELALPFGVRRALPASVTAHLEERINARGNFEVLGFVPVPGGTGEVTPVLRYAVVGGERHQVFTFGKALGYVTRQDVPLNGIRVPVAAAATAPRANGLPGSAYLMALDPQPSRLLDAAELAELRGTVGDQANCVTSGQSWTKNQEPVAEEIGGKILTFCGKVHAEDWAAAAIAAAGLETPPPPANLPVSESSYTEGRKRMLLMRPVWSDYTGGMTTNDALTHFQNFSNYMWQLSYGKLVLAALGSGSEVTPPMLLPGLVADYDDTGLGKLYTTCRDVAATNYGYDLSQFDFTYVCTGGKPAASYAGLAYVGGVGFHLANGYWDAAVSSHEFGHNLGLNHAHFWETGARSIIGTGQNVEYGDNNDPMGGGGNPNQYNSRYKNYLGWIPNADIADLNVSGSGRYRLYCFDLDTSVGLRGLKFTRNSSQNYWVNFRQRKTSKRALMNGVQLLWTGNGNQGSYLLDVRLKNTADDNAVVIGRTFSDTAAGFHFTPVGKGNTYPESMDVVVNVGTFPANQPPTAMVSASTLGAAPGQNVTFVATAGDPNGDSLAYYWEFGDGDYSIDNRPVVAHSFSAAGEYAVQCVVSDMKGGTARRSVVVKVGSPGTFRISGHVLDSSNRPLAGILVRANTGQSVFTDSDGAYTLPGLAAGSYTLEALEPVAGSMSFPHPFFNNPVTVGPNFASADFVGIVGTLDIYQPLSARGASWRYLDNGVDQGTAWRAPGFNDSSWPTGVAPLGYPSGAPIATVINYGPDSNNKFTSYYFRRPFVVNDPNAYTNLQLEVLRDDGVLVYLNGVEVFRNNMPAGTVTYGTFATDTVEPDSYLSATLSRSLLVSGTNILAAEVHQATANSSDIAFDAALSGLSVSNATGFNLVYISSPPDRAVLTSPTNVVIDATALAGSGTVSSVAFYADGTWLGDDTVAPYQYVWSGAADGAHTLRVVATIGSMQITSPAVVVTLSMPQTSVMTTPLTLITTNAVWRYLATGGAPPATWANPGFSDGGWPSGAAQLGYGEGDEATTVPFGGNTSSKWITTYFRRTFVVQEPALITNLTVSLLRDDGGIVYLNGTEVFRSNMPEGPVNYLSLANNADDDGKAIFGSAIPTSLLVPGNNVIAVEIHQDSASSSDVSFALGLTADLIQVPRGVYLTAPTAGTVNNVPVDLSLHAIASGGPGVGIASVEFFADGISIGSDTTAPYTAVLNRTEPGSVELVAVATDTASGTLTSAPVTIQFEAPRPGTALVSFGDTWKYLDDGSWPGSAWTLRNFDDRLWNSGPARLGYGGDGELTTVSFGPNVNAKYVTTYFRRSFSVTNPAAFSGLALRLVRDDAAVVYLNDIEVYRNNLQPGLVSWNSLADATVEGTDERTPLSVELSAAALVPGTNVVAVEIHQASVSSSDLGFDLALAGLNDVAAAPVVYLINPAAGAHYNVPASVPLAAYIQVGEPVTLVEYFDGDQAIGQSSVPPYAFTWNNPAAGNHSLTARATYGAGSTLTSEAVPIVVGAAPAPVAPVFQTLVSARTQWKYWDNAAAVGTGWQRTDFNDNLWPGGLARFGFGLDGEATSLTPGRTTWYFRRWFNVGNPALLNQLVFQLARDDGAIVYLNGVEVFRSNMPDGPVTASTLALTTVNTPDETTYFEVTLPSSGSGLVAGTNLVAVELHQAAANSSDAGFDLQLVAYGTTDSRVVLTCPTANASYHIADQIPVEAFVWTGGARTVNQVEFYLQGQKLGEVSAAPYRLSLAATNYGTYTLVARATFSDGAQVESSPLNVTVTRQAVTTTLIAGSSVWRYLDNGSNQGTNWTLLNYVESGWKTGAARLGYGGDGEVTPVGYGPNASAKYITTYFRRAVVIPAGFAYTNLAFRLLRDDGAVVWLNGRELFRSNMPATPVAYTTTASAPVSGADEQTFFPTTVQVPPLPAGTNIVAVEIHQNAANSSDLGFDLELVASGYIIDDPQPRLSIRTEDGMVELSWPVSAVGWQVYGAPEIAAPPASWFPVEGTTVAVNGSYVLTVAPTADQQFFRLGRP